MNIQIKKILREETCLQTLILHLYSLLLFCYISMSNLQTAKVNIFQADHEISSVVYAYTVSSEVLCYLVFFLDIHLNNYFRQLSPEKEPFLV